MDRITFVTVCTNSHLAYAITLARSLRAALPGAKLVTYITDKFDKVILPDLEEIEFVAAEAIGIEGFDDMAGRYNAFEFSTALKAPCILHALEKRGAVSVVYLDSDTLVLGPLDAVSKALAQGYDCILTPHITSPTREGEVPTDRAYLTAGVFNLGFAAFSNRPPAMAFLRWWSQMKREDCSVNKTAGVFVDQTYCNLAPAFIERLHVLRDPGYNLAYWNLAQRPVSFDEFGVASTGEHPIRLVHFSGADFRIPEVISRYNLGLNRDNAGAFAIVFDRYVAAVAANDVIHEGGFSSIPFAFGREKEPFLEAIEVTADVPAYVPEALSLYHRVKQWLGVR